MLYTPIASRLSIVCPCPVQLGETKAAAAAALLEAEAGLSDNEKALVKGMPHNTWSGPPLLDSITGGAHTGFLL